MAEQEPIRDGAHDASQIVDVMDDWGCLDIWCALSLVTAPPATPQWQMSLIRKAQGG